MLAQQGMSKTVKKKPGLSSSELLVEACLRFATCMQAQAVENSKAQVAEENRLNLADGLPEGEELLNPAVEPVPSAAPAAADSAAAAAA